MNPYSQDELISIEKQKKINEDMESFFDERRVRWNTEIEPLLETLKADFNIGNAPKVIEVQSLALSFRQRIAEEISLFMDKRSKAMVKIKKVRQDKFLFYATNFGVKTNMGEKTILIEAHLSELLRSTELIENYIEYLRACNKTLESIGFVIKNIIELHNYLGKN